jgi:hypothetical protein
MWKQCLQRPIITGMRGPRRYNPLAVVSHSVVLVDDYKISRHRTIAVLRPAEFRVIGMEADRSPVSTMSASHCCCQIRPHQNVIALSRLGRHLLAHDGQVQGLLWRPMT